MSSLFAKKYAINEEFDNNADIVISHGDVIEKLKTLPSGAFKLIISSPPYNLGKEYEKETNLDDYLQWQSKVITEMYRICHNSGSIVWQVGNYVNNGEVFPLDIYFYPLFKKYGLKLRNRIIWHFGHGLHASKRFSGRYETLLWFSKSDDYTFNLDPVRVPSKYPGKCHYKGEKIGQPSGNPLGKNPSDYWEIIAKEWENGVIDIPNVKSNHPEKTEHPCSFPVELVERCVLALTNENDWVLDPFGGVGSSLIAAIKQHRKGMIVDKEEKYLETTRQRIEKYENGELKMRSIGTQIFEPTGHEKISQVPLEWIGRKEGANNESCCEIRF
ncbi:DNA-methyltransferase [Treponema endosymbiont of Eucomonympha sp.]|uniref:DNA-methyltransferase n=1 Tax=Treponema endosymbiont of Eucomonympha sp. TaxID=1580831 RepID=UPI000A83D75A|nr:site-specific DNA-methyltransferase [Treponema endosymbiont of Eucomonympha sp.]